MLFLHENHPDLIDGEVQADFALNPEMLKRNFSKLAGKKLTP
jgi:malate dehydrogenase (oxaloacetate-decarboxylating)(NADP+)